MVSETTRARMKLKLLLEGNSSMPGARQMEILASLRRLP
jgi:hypothetical protein